MSKFEIASRKKLRFDSPKGLLSVEDLWDLPLTSASKASLDNIAKALYKQLKESDTVSFVTPSSKSDETTQLAFDIVKHVIDVRIAERDAASEAEARRTKKQAILAVIAQKETTALYDADIDALRKMAESL